MPIDPKSVPDFDDLPPVKDMPQGCAWGVFDQDGKRDKVGTLNFLTPEIVKAAAAEVQHGMSISLNWPLNANMLSFRAAAQHRIVFLPDVIDFLSENPRCWDDEITFNTQVSSQWDSLCHVQEARTGMAYNGTTPTRETLAATPRGEKENELPTLEHWHEAGCMAARGVLVDYKAYAEENNIPFHPLDGVPITPADLEACAAHQGVEFRHGDVLLLRTGATDVLENPTEADAARFKRHAAAGLHGCEETARWLWNRRFSAVASDTLALEVLPGLDKGTNQCLALHQYLLSLFGMSIGELWHLRDLASACKRTGKYSFMLTSVPLNFACLIGSPPNALAIL